MVIRTAVIADMPFVFDLIQELAIFETQPNAVEITIQDLENDGFCEQPLFGCFVAEIKNEIVGIALYYYRYSTWKGRTIHLEDLIVRKKHRSSGVGIALYTQIMHQAEKENIRRVEWAVLNWNQPAIDFYKKTGASHQPEWDVVQMEEKDRNTFLKKQK